MNSRISPKTTLIAVGALVLVSWLTYPTPGGAIFAPSAFDKYEVPDTYENYYRSPSNYIPDGTESRETKSPKVKETKFVKNSGKYKYRVEIEVVPENQIYSIKKSGYNEYSVSSLGVNYSYEVWEFYHDEILNESQCESYIRNNPHKCKRLSTDPQQNIYDEFQDNYDDYMADPEDEITYDPEIYDFLAD